VLLHIFSGLFWCEHFVTERLIFHLPVDEHNIKLVDWNCAAIGISYAKLFDYFLLQRLIIYDGAA
jgi:hypothetical protein